MIYSATHLRWALAALALGAAVTLAAPTRADDRSRQWVEAWGASPQEPVDPVTGGTAQSFSNQTIRQIVRLSVGGEKLRLRLTNEYGTAPVTFASVHVAITGPGGTILAGSDRLLHFSGQASVTVPPAAPILSDTIDYPVDGLSTITVSLYIPAGGNPGPATPHSLGVQTAYIAAGDQTTSLTLNKPTTTTSRYFISGVDLKIENGATIVTLGNSITDGYASTVDANHRWPDFLAQRLQATRSLRHLAIADEGISGNRVLSDGIGPNALSRFDRDVLSRPGVKFVTVLEGINDIGFPNISAPLPNLGKEPTSDQIIAGYRQLIHRAHENGLLIYGGTLTPYKPSGYYTAAGDAIRNTVNSFIRNSGEFDGILDFDAATRDPANPSSFLPAYDSGDHLHPNDAGYAAMANAINLRLFQLEPGDR